MLYYQTLFDTINIYKKYAPINSELDTLQFANILENKVNINNPINQFYIGFLIEVYDFLNEKVKIKFSENGVQVIHTV